MLSVTIILQLEIMFNDDNAVTLLLVPSHYSMPAYSFVYEQILSRCECYLVFDGQTHVSALMSFSSCITMSSVVLRYITLSGDSSCGMQCELKRSTRIQKCRIIISLTVLTTVIS